MNKLADTMCMRMLMNVSLCMVHFQREALHASVCRNRALHSGAVVWRVLWVDCAML